MNNLQKINPLELTENVIKLIGKDWLLVSAGDKERHNTMTANWGSMGFYSNLPIATIFIRPERYTYDIIEENDYFTLTFFSEEYRDALAYLGKNSGRDGDKISETKLTPTFTEGGNLTFTEGRIVLECRKIFGQDMTESSFVDTDILNKWYGEGHGNLHKIYMGVIENCWIR